MKWISVDEFLPGKKLPDNGWIITRCVNRDGCFFYQMASYNGIWEFLENYHDLEKENFTDETYERELQEKVNFLKVTHWMIPDQIKDEKENETKGTFKQQHKIPT
jgi:hypothetical protein